MKKITLVLLLALVVILPACRPPSSSFCTFHGLTPGVTYRIFYPASGFPPVPVVGTQVANFNGSITVPSRGFNCGLLQIRAVLNFNVPLTANPSVVYLPSPPATVTITGHSFDTTYGMPIVEYFDSNGYMVGSVYASSVSSDGTSLEASLPNLSYVYSGTYQIKVTNMTYEGYYLNIVGIATLTGWGRDRADTDGDGWYDDEDCDPYDPYLNYSCVQTCGGGQYEYVTICPAY